MSPAAFKEWRTSRLISQSELSVALGIHPITVSKIERGVLPFKGELTTRLRGIIQQGAEANDLLNRKVNE